MTSIVDSEAHLAQRASDVGLTAASVAALRHHGFTTLGKLAFAHGQPGTQIDANQFHTFAANVLGAFMTLGDEAALKRLLLEGHTLVLKQLRESVTFLKLVIAESSLRWSAQPRWRICVQG